VLQELLKAKLRMAREKKGYKQEDIAVKLGVSLSSYSRYERGERKISAELIEQIAELTDIPIAWFFTPDDSSNTHGILSTTLSSSDFQQQILQNTNRILTNTDSLLTNTDKIIKRLTVSQILEEKSSLNNSSHTNLIPFPGSPHPHPHPSAYLRTLPLMEQAIGAGEKLAENITSIGTITVPCQGKPDVAIRVEGLSMEPDILDGSLILVRRTQIYGSWGWNNWDIVVVWLKETDEWTVKQIQVSPDRTKAKLIGTKGYLKRYEIKDIEVQGVVEDVIKDPEEVEAIIQNMKETQGIITDGNIGTAEHTDTDATLDNPPDNEIPPEKI